MTMKKTKQIEKYTHNHSTAATDGSEVTRLIRVVIIITVIFLAFYILTLFLTKKDNSSKNEEKTTTIQYDEIILGTLLSQKQSEYYVLVYESEDPYLKVLENYVSLYGKQDEKIKVYTANLNNVFNESYIGEKLSATGTNVADFKFKNTTLVKIKDKKVVETYDTLDKITNHFKSLIKTEK